MNVSSWGMRLGPVLVCCAAACGGGNRLGPAGSDRDEGNGELARASQRLLTGGDRDDLYDASGPARREPDLGLEEEDPPLPEDDASIGGWSPQPDEYVTLSDLTGVIEGTVTWAGARPARYPTPCGPVEVARIGARNAVAGVLVWIEDPEFGPAPSGTKADVVGGIVSKQGCAFRPTAQPLVPTDSPIAIHGDATAVEIQVSWVSGPRPVRRMLDAGGRVDLRSGDTAKIEAVDGSVAPAWIVGLSTPYYAVTDDRGRYRIDEVRPGATYELTFWHPPVTKGGSPLIVKRSVRVTDKRAAKLDVVLK